jgi:predicted transposase/invertase (TIGR01784 family)
MDARKTKLQKESRDTPLASNAAMSKFINPYTDFGFKKLFGEEANKDLLIDFLNTILPEKHQIDTLEFRNQEQLGPSASERRAVFDIFCENSKGEPFIVEMQKEDQEFFKDRSLFYSAYPIREQGQRGKRELEQIRKEKKKEKEWNFELKAVYLIAILDFIYDKDDPDRVLIREVSLKDQFGKEFCDKLRMFYIQMPIFDKTETELVTRQDKWLYFLQNLPSLDHIPAIMKEEVLFQKAFHTSEIAAMSKKERDQYEYELNHYRTYWATIETAEKKGEAKGEAKGKAEGKAEEKIEIARNMKKRGLDAALIAEMTGLSIEEIKQLE